MNRSTKTFVFFKNYSFIFSSFLLTCMFPTYCFRQRPFVVHFNLKYFSRFGYTTKKKYTYIFFFVLCLMVSHSSSAI